MARLMVMLWVALTFTVVVSGFDGALSDAEAFEHDSDSAVLRADSLGALASDDDPTYSYALKTGPDSLEWTQAKAYAKLHRTHAASTLDDPEQSEMQAERGKIHQLMVQAREAKAAKQDALVTAAKREVVKERESAERAKTELDSLGESQTASDSAAMASKIKQDAYAWVRKQKREKHEMLQQGRSDNDADRNANMQQRRIAQSYMMLQRKQRAAARSKLPVTQHEIALGEAAKQANRAASDAGADVQDITSEEKSVRAEVHELGDEADESKQQETAAKLKVAAIELKQLSTKAQKLDKGYSFSKVDVPGSQENQLNELRSHPDQFAERGGVPIKTLVENKLRAKRELRRLPTEKQDVALAKEATSVSHPCTSIDQLQGDPLCAVKAKAAKYAKAHPQRWHVSPAQYVKDGEQMKKAHMTIQDVEAQVVKDTSVRAKLPVPQSVAIKAINHDERTEMKQVAPEWHKTKSLRQEISNWQGLSHQHTDTPQGAKNYVKGELTDLEANRVGGNAETQKYVKPQKMKKIKQDMMIQKAKNVKIQNVNKEIGKVETEVDIDRRLKKKKKSDNSAMAQIEQADALLQVEEKSAFALLSAARAERRVAAITKAVNKQTLKQRKKEDSKITKVIDGIDKLGQKQKKDWTNSQIKIHSEQERDMQDEHVAFHQYNVRAAKIKHTSASYLAQADADSTKTGQEVLTAWDKAEKQNEASSEGLVERIEEREKIAAKAVPRFGVSRMKAVRTAETLLGEAASRQAEKEVTANQRFSLDSIIQAHDAEVKMQQQHEMRALNVESQMMAARQKSLGAGIAAAIGVDDA